MEHNFHLRDMIPSLAQDKRALAAFLLRHQLRLEDDIDYAAAFVDDEDEIMACGCAAGSVLKCFAVDERLRGHNLLGQLLSALMADRFAKGRFELFVYTKPQNSALFINSGFHPLLTTDKVAMLENREGGVARFTSAIAAPCDGVCGAVVMNCNPFTLGHRYLAEYAAAHCRLLYLFVVEEDRSVFPFADRLRLVQEGVADISNIRVCPGGPYMISAATFPTYFLKQDDDAVAIEAELDLRLFGEQIAPQLNISRRFVGEEPACAVTQQYNRLMRELLPPLGVEVVEIPRKTESGGTAISASTVRRLIAEGADQQLLRRYLPDSSCAYLQTPAGRAVAAQLRGQS
ncbi:MAG: [citrate (pro-3S)-lyase] ligase [Bacillota bacterium]|nr:[citrate (pro-3S)-lyase] ligase [Bacillota bacterium]